MLPPNSLPELKMLYYLVCLGMITLLSGHVSPYSPECRSVCGDMVIKYPFGIGLVCSRDEYFEVMCITQSSNPKHKPKPFLRKYNLEILDLQSYGFEGQITVKNPSVVTQCIDISNKTGNSTRNEVVKKSSFVLSGSPYYFDAYDNEFASVGCDGYASLYNVEGAKISGCSSTCSPAGAPVDGCDGYHCCRSDFRASTDPTDDVLKIYSIGVTNYVPSDRGRSCRSAFLVSRMFMQTNRISLTSSVEVNSTVPVVLRWWTDQRGKVPNVLLMQVLRIVVIPAVAAVIISWCCIWSCWMFKTRKKRSEAKLRAKYFKGRLAQSSSDRGVTERTKLFTIKELKRATENFNVDRVIGQGGQGTVYKGMLSSGQIIAVKRSRSFEESQWKQFINEVVLLSQVNHRNIVKLLGSCLETKVPLLVYEFISNGTLAQHIHNFAGEFLLTWTMRVRIAFEAAGAIAYLHSSSTTPIYHRDIKSNNILLDEKYQAKVSDFGISKAVTIDNTHLTTCVRGTFGYLDPEYFRSSQFSEKSDVYSFGVILVEILTGQPPIRVAALEEERSLVVYFLMNESRLEDILDPIVLADGSKEEVTLVADLAKRCLHPRGFERPTMNEVTIELGKIVTRSTFSSTITLEHISAN